MTAASINLMCIPYWRRFTARSASISPMRRAASPPMRLTISASATVAASRPVRGATRWCSTTCRLRPAAAALEAALALQALAGARVGVEIVAPEPRFFYRPLAVAQPSVV